MGPWDYLENMGLISRPVKLVKVGQIRFKVVLIDKIASNRHTNSSNFYQSPRGGR